MPENEAPEQITLATYADGAVEELFRAAIEKVLDNIDDPNTAPDAKRSITIKLTFTPDDNRREIKVGVECSPRLAAGRPLSSTVFMGRHGGRLIAREAFRQETMFPEPVGRPTLADERSA